MPNLSEILPSLGAGLGVPGMQNTLACPSIQHAVVCLIDGLGARLLDQHRASAPALAQGVRSDIDTVFPSTTPSALASLGTGMLPGSHGIVGASFVLPETGTVLSPLSWRDGPSPLAVQPEPTMFERLARLGITVTTVAAPEYERSGLTAAVLRGSTYRAVEQVAERCEAVHAASSGPDRSLTYVYWPNLDRIGHAHGAGSPEWIRALAEVDALVSGLVDRLPDHAALVVTSDHGMVNCPPQSRIVFEQHDDLMADVRLLCGEPRVRHLYVAPGTVRDVQHRWRDHVEGRARVLSREELVDSGLLGEVEDFAEERIGDLVVIALGDTMIASSVDSRVSSLVGQHGALTMDEWRVPAVWFTTD